MTLSKLRVLFFVLPILAACSSTTNSATNGGGTGGSGTCTPNNTDGASSCEGHTEPCAGGQYCSVNICNAGCLSTANCPNGLFCDMSAASHDNFLDKPVGICRACPTTGGGGTGNTDAGSGGGGGGGGGGTCSDVHGAYTMSADPGSSQGCGTVSGECAVTQSGCKVTISCQGSGTNTVDLDANDKGSYTQTITTSQGTINANCAVSFTSSSMLIDCQFTASGGAATCKADGIKK